MPWHIEKQDGRHCVIKNDDGHNQGCHDTRESAEKQMAALYANEEMMQSKMYLLDDFLTVRKGEPYRLFPLGRIVKGGTVREITKELAGKFRLPHFRPAIKLGSHKEETPAGGHIIGLEVREDGLYAIPEYNDEGEQALTKGAFRYHSPEVIWEGGMEDPATGGMIPAPLIIGDALLHTPHLGEAAALYSVEPYTREENQMTDTVQIPASLWEKFLAKLFPPVPDEPRPEPEPKKPEGVEVYEAAVRERDEYKAKLATLEAEATKKARVDQFAAQLKETKVGEGADILAGMTDEQANWVITQFKALSVQIKESALLDEIGTVKPNTLPEDPRLALHQIVLAHMGEKKVDYNTALATVMAERPELVQAAYQ